jgi:hypothetical protein
MSDRARRLTEKGISQFRDYLAKLRKDRSLAIPERLLVDPECSESIRGAPSVERPGFATKRQAAEYLAKSLAPLGASDIMRDAGLWSWLALYYFQDICPKDSEGKRKPVADPHYILDAQNSKRRYRHLLATPYQIINVMPDHNRIFLDAPLSVHGDLVEQTMGRLYLIRLAPVREIMDRLYYDKERGKAKRGIISKKEKPGDLRNRLPIRIRQLQKTYDVAGLTGDQLLDLLGSEFDRWAAA